jgi:preprotein translocase subunit SecA
MERWFPGSRLLLGQEQTVGCAGPHFGLVSSVCGRLVDLPGVGRNDPCPCESGRKFKRCHGDRGE